MKCVIPAAGRGTRLRPLTDEKPKPLVEINGKPLLWHIVNTFPESIDEIILIVKYKGDMIREYCGGEFLGRRVTYIEQQELAGTADALLLAKDHLNNEPFMLHYSDDILDRDSIERLLKHNLGVLVIEREDPRRFGVIIPKENNLVEGVIEKPEEPPSNLISAGVMKLDKRIFNYKAERHSNGEYYLTTMFDQMARDHDVHYEVANRFLSIATPEDLKNVEEILRNES